MKNRKFELPLPVDEKGKPSLTLLCAWVSFFAAEILTFQVASEVQSEIGKLSVLGVAFFTAIFFSLMMRVRRVDSINFDLKNGKLNIDTDGKPAIQQSPQPAQQETIYDPNINP